MDATTLGYAFLGGLLPALLWLYFLLKEDAKHPEPKRLIALTFVLGMLVVPLAIPFQQYAAAHLSDSFSIITAWALIEEMLKYIVAAAFILWRRAVDEAPDYVIYMITVALGFAAAENMLFIAAPLTYGNFLAGFFTGDVRFLGSTLLHIIASATIGFAFAFSQRSSPLRRTMAAAAGLILAVALHTAFNLIIMSTMDSDQSNLWPALHLVWFVALIFFAAFEVLKYFQSRPFSH